MAAIGIPHADPWIVARWAFHQLLERARLEADSTEDVEALIRAEALDGLHFDLLEPDQRVRLAKTVARAADGLRLSLSSSDSDDPRDAEFAEYLSVLEMRLHDLFE